jgi:hypothetical protein
MSLQVEQKREALRKLGFRRRDRTLGGKDHPNKHHELWEHENFRHGLGQPLESCWNHVLRHRFITITETGQIVFQEEGQES